MNRDVCVVLELLLPGRLLIFTIAFWAFLVYPVCDCFAACGSWKNELASKGHKRKKTFKSKVFVVSLWELEVRLMW